MQEKSLTHGIKFKERLGYALGDAAGMLTFSLIGAFQNKFYTDVLGISPAKIAILILVARLWDAINDPMWGAFIDSRKPTKYGKFRPYIFGFSVPLAVAALMMFTVIPGLSEARYLLYAYISYIFYGMMYTAVNIPYGSLASVITDDEKERSSLSMWRSIGAGVGGLPGTILMPMIVYNTVTAEDGTKIQILDGGKLTACVAVLSVISVIVFALHFKLTKERIAPLKKEKGDYNALKTIKDLVLNRPFMMVSISSMLLISFQFYYQATYNYLFADYFHSASLYSLVTICTYLPMAILIPVMNKLIDKLGKKEICAWGMVLAAAVNLILFFIKTNSPVVFLVFMFFSGLGQSFLVLEVWALVMDVIDYHELRTGRREEGTAYAFVSFMRKLGQTLAGVGLNALLAIIGYDSELSSNGQALPQAVLDKLYNISTLVPAVVLAIASVVLMFGYNLNKKKLGEMRAELEKKRTEE